MTRVFNDSKHFVDMKMKHSPTETLKKFDEFLASHNNEVSKENLTVWVEENFEPPGSEFENWTPVDHHSNPKILEKISDPVFKKWASDLNDIWLELGRKMKSDVLVGV
jgi:alpha,alpha-trehalase